MNGPGVVCLSRLSCEELCWVLSMRFANCSKITDKLVYTWILLREFISQLFVGRNIDKKKNE